MKRLLLVTAILEGSVGAAMVVSPAVMVTLLVGAPLEGPAALTVARIGGAAIVALGITNWFATSDARSHAARGLVAAMFVYNVAAGLVLIYAGVGWGLYGIALWPGVLLHAAMAVWCGACLRNSLDGSHSAV